MKKIITFTQEIHDVILSAWQKGYNSKYLATIGKNYLLNILDKYGNIIHSFNLDGKCLGLNWSNNGYVLALVTDIISTIKLWKIDQNNIININTGIQEVFNLIIWATKSQNLLATTTIKGTVLIFDHITTRKIPLLDKHSKIINCGIWTNEDLLVLICEDQILSISDKTGDTLYILNLKSKSSLLKLSLIPIEFNKDSNSENLSNFSIGLSLVLDHEKLYIICMNKFDKTLTITFQEKYGKIFDYFWLLNGNLIIVFEQGYVVNFNTESNQFNQEIAYVHLFSNSINGTAFCDVNNSLLVFKNNILKILNINNLDQVDKIFTVEEETLLNWCDWSSNGQMLACFSVSGRLHVYLTKLPCISCAYLTKICYLTSLLELSYFDIEENINLKKQTIYLEIEPTVIAIGIYHLATCINNKAYFYQLPNSKSNNWQNSFKEMEYSSIIKKILLNDSHVAILFSDYKACLHLIPNFENNKLNNVKILSEENKKLDKNNFFNVNYRHDVSDIVLTHNLFIWCTQTGNLEVFSINDWSSVAIFHHTNKIEKISCSYTGLNILIVDSQNTAFIYDAITEQSIPLEYYLTNDKDIKDKLDLEIFKQTNILELPSNTNLVVAERNYSREFPLNECKILWDSFNCNCFIVVDDTNILIYFFVKKSISGSFVQLVDKLNLSSKCNPLLFYNGLLYFQNINGSINSILLDTHKCLKSIQTENEINQAKNKILINLLKLRRNVDCWSLCEKLNDLDCWQHFMNCCLHDFDLNTGIKIARFIGNVGIVWSLQSLIKIEEKNFLAAHLAMFLKWYDLSEQLFLKSSQPINALNLRLDLMQWEKSLILAKRLCPQKLPYINKQHASELELNGDYLNALNYYQKALIENEKIDDSFYNQHNLECKIGLSRCLIHSGNPKKGLELIFELNNNNLELIKSCAETCEKNNLLNEGAYLYEKAEDLENACILFLKIRNLNKVKELFDKSIKNKMKKLSVNVLKVYAKMQEQDGNYLDALKAYQEANLHLECVQLLLNKLNRPQEAVQLVRNKNINNAYILIANYFQKINDFESAIEFFVYSEKYEESFELALQNSQMEFYANSLIDFLITKYKELNFIKNEVNFVNLEGNLSEVILKQIQKLALYFEEEHNYFLAGKFFCLLSQIKKGIKYLLQAYTIQKTKKNNLQDNSSKTIKLAIDFVCKSNDEESIRDVIDTLLNNLDENQKDFKYLFKLYMSLGQYREANKTVIFLAQEEQNKGNYHIAYDFLFQMAKCLIEKKSKLSFELLNSLHLLHCYYLAKFYLKLENFRKSCELFCKISNNIIKFPKHAGQILLSTIIQCLKIGLKSKSIKYSFLLLQNEDYYNQIDIYYKKKIDALIRKSATIKKNFEKENIFCEKSNCPFCDQMVPNLQLTCTSCQNVIPFSIITGYHLSKNDIYSCNSCKFLFNFKEFKIYENLQNTCPMCKEIFSFETISKYDLFNQIN